MSHIQSIILMIVPLLFSIILHEVSHGWVAGKLGDPTAKLMGRLTLNPVPHIDPIGSIVVPGILLLSGTHFLFGWAKPVPVNFANLRGGRKSMALVALSGPLTNFLLALLSAIVYHLTLVKGTGALHGAFIVPIHAMAFYAVLLNLVLMLFNLLPILPLDGGRIAVGLLPESIAIPFQRTERWGMLIVVLVVVSDVWTRVLGPVIYLFLQILGVRI
jgi:Zn-dependent protease